MNRHMKKLLKELGADGRTAVLRDSGGVVRSVNRKLNLNPPERARYRVQRAVRLTAAVCALTLTLALTAFAVSRLDILGLIFGDAVAPYVVRPAASVSDGRFLCRVEQALTSPSEVTAVVSVQGLTDEAAEILADPDQSYFTDGFWITFAERGRQLPTGASLCSEELTGLRGGGTSYYLLIFEGGENPDRADMAVDFLFLEQPPEKRRITLPVSEDVATVRAERDGVRLTLSPIALRLESGSALDADAELGFRMKDGRVMTEAQLFRQGGRCLITTESEDGGLRSTLTVIARDALKPEDFEAVIYGGEEFRPE